jgi:hypothetical protein
MSAQGFCLRWIIGQTKALFLDSIFWRKSYPVSARICVSLHVGMVKTADVSAKLPFSIYRVNYYVS